MKFRKSRLLGMLSILLLLGYGCFRSPEIISDISNLKQDHTFYLSGVSADEAIVDSETQKKLSDDYTKRFFSVWSQVKPRSTREDAILDFRTYEDPPGYGENRRKHDEGWMEELRLNAGLNSYPNRSIRGITVANTDLRALPTSKPYFRGLDNGSGYPFDRLQLSALMVNTPVYVTHASRDGDWLLVETGFYFGWVRAVDVATVDESFVQSWLTGQYAMVIQDPTPIYDEKNRFCFKAPLGSQFPILREEGGFIFVGIAVANENRQAVLKVSRLSKDSAARRPLKMTRRNLARVGNELIGQPYGWGGFNENRDCSALTMDFFAPFGIWLPRNSGQQAHEAGRFINLEKLSPEKKEQAILQYGIPYATLIWRQGHIMLYIGAYKGKALIFHNMWGVSTLDLRGRKGRRIVGQAVITTLRPGIELCSNRSAGCDTLRSVRGMTLLLPGATAPAAGGKPSGFTEEDLDMETLNAENSAWNNPTEK